MAEFETTRCSLQHPGEGLAGECLEALLDHAGKTMELSTIVAETQSANTASRKFLEKHGMEFEKIVSRFGEQQMIYRKKLL